MSKTLASIQTAVQYHARDSSLSLTTTTNLAIVNKIYRSLSALLPLPELRLLYSFSTTADDEDYTWSSSTIFLDVVSVTMQDEEDNNYYKLITPVPDEWTWAKAGTKPSQSIPDHYLRQKNSLGTNLILFRPLPKYSSKTVRIFGSTEPTELAASTDTTVFIQKTMDDIFEYLIAADFSIQTGFIEWGRELEQRANILIRGIFGREIYPAELTRQVVQK